MAFLHGLQQGGLGTRAGAVDLIRHQQAAEDRTGKEAEMALAVIALLENLRAENIGRHQIRGELDALGVEPGGNRYGLNQLRLGQARRADQEGVAAGKDCGETEIDLILEAENYPPNRGFDGFQALGRCIRFCNQLRTGFMSVCHRTKFLRHTGDL